VPGRPWVLKSDQLQEPPLTDLEQIDTYPEALATTLEVMQRDLGLPRLQVMIIFVPDSKSMTVALVRIGYTPRLARESARQMTATGGYRAILINQARLERLGWPGRVSTLAHELGHVLQYELGAGEQGPAAQWLSEGSADWLGMRVMEALGGEVSEKAMSHAVMRVRSQSRPQLLILGGSRRLRMLEGPQTIAEVPPLGALHSWPEWVAQLRSPAGAVLYDYAFVAATTLVERHGVQAVLRYFELFTENQDPAANFLAAFGEREEDFDARLRQTVWP
jgi:hypothetical protein